MESDPWTAGIIEQLMPIMFDRCAAVAAVAAVQR
jgi:hypothetical protein